jgi:histidine decarboxylase
MKNEVNRAFMAKKRLLSLSVAVLLLSSLVWSQSAIDPELDAMVEVWKTAQQTTFGYPASQESNLAAFYRWYLASGMDVVNLNNAGDPMTDDPSTLSTQKFERQVIEFFAPLYDFKLDNVWGIVTHSGTDGNNHGIYFGVNYLRNKTGMEPVLYVSDEAHYSNMRLAHLQNVEMYLVASDSMGRMIPDSLEKVLVTSRPALMVYAMGSTFKGAIDDQKALNAVLASHPEIPAVYRHVDAALFGGYLPFTPYRDLVSRESMHYESISVSGHKFFGLDSPSGLFICTREVYDNQESYNVPYLNSNMKMINCSRDALQPLKFWWLTKDIGYNGWTMQATKLLHQRDYLKHKMDSIGWPNWVNEYSNTVFFRRPSAKIVAKYTLAQGYDDRFGGELAHVVVMQHVSKEKIDMFIDDLIEEQPKGIPAVGASSHQSGTEKMVRDGQLYIVTDDKTYTLTGAEVR